MPLAERSAAENSSLNWSVDDGFNIKKLRVKQADQDGALTYIASTYDPLDQVIRDGIYEGGRKIISFCGVLQQGIFPLPELLQMVQKYGSEEMKRPVEIEFACNLNNDKTGELYLLQIRPIVDTKQMLDEDLTLVPQEQCLLRSANSLGHGISEDVVDVVYVKTGDDFTAANNPMIARDIEKINQRFLNGDFKAPVVSATDSKTNEAPSGAVGGASSVAAGETSSVAAGGTNYILIGPGRWGSSDPWLGIPVKWPHISAARVIVETALKNYHVDPSQGTHFFQNLTSFGVGYFTIDTNSAQESAIDSSAVSAGAGKDIVTPIFRQDLLDQMPAVEETEYVRHVRFARPLKVMMDGKKQLGIVQLPASL